MDIQIRGHNVKVSENIVEYTNKQLERLSRYLPNISSIHVDFSKQNSSRGPDVMVAQITLRHNRGAILRAEEKLAIDGPDSAKTVLNSAVDKMYRRIRRFKGKKKNKQLRRYEFTAEELLLAEEMPDIEDEVVDVPDAEGELVSQIIRRKSVAVSAMNEEEAVEQMELLGHTFFIFFNADKNQVNVVYKRQNGGYGVLVPELG